MNQPNQLLAPLAANQVLAPATPDQVLDSAKPIFQRFLEHAKTLMQAERERAVESKKKIASFRIANDDALDSVGNQARFTAAHVDKLEAQRTAITKPLNDLLRAVNAVYQPAKKAWAEVAELAEAEILRYIQARSAAAQQAAVAAEQISQQALMSVPAAQAYQALTAHAAAPPPKVEGISQVEHWAWELAGATDAERAYTFSLVPREFLCLDEKKINAYVSVMKGEAQIPGIRVFRDDHLSVKRPAP